MSRALDKGTKEALRDGDNAKAFEEISAGLSQTCHSLLEIELLGQSHVLDSSTSFLQAGNAIAIPKLQLVQAFIFARKIFMEHPQDDPSDTDQRIRKTTAVMLLMDPEHLTAANTRKRLLANALSGREDAATLLLNERLFIDSLLTSRLRRHTKSPVLWSHRRWLMEQFPQLGLATDAAEALRTVVFVSAERHPRNYHAWCYARHLIDSVDLGDETRQAGLDVPTIIEDTKKWCFSHHDDISGWMFLAFLLGKWPAEAAPTLGETLKLTESLRWRNESVWCFLRNMMPRAHVAEPQGDHFQSVWKALRENTHDGSLDRKVLDEASRWTEVYSANRGCT